MDDESQRQINNSINCLKTLERDLKYLKNKISAKEKEIVEEKSKLSRLELKLDKKKVATNG